jgi:hypothetical protein
MADLDRRRLLLAIGLVPAGVLLLAGCPGGDDEGGDDEDGEDGEDGGGQNGDDDD